MSKKTLIVGGTGGIGSYLAIRLSDEGQCVTIAGRREPDKDSILGKFSFLRGDFTTGGFTEADLEPFHDVIFAAALDSRQVPKGLPLEEHGPLYLEINGERVPEFFLRARNAGVRRIAYVGSFYPDVRPSLVDRFPYVRSRLLADERTRALATEYFKVVNLNAPAIIGEGLGTGLQYQLAKVALGQAPSRPIFAPAGGTNFMSVQSLYEAIVGALDNGQNGKAYLVGDENLLYSEVIRMFFQAAGKADEVIPVRNEATSDYLGSQWAPVDEPPVFYEPYGASELGYRQHDIERAIREIVDGARSQLDRTA
jgi:dihydroflavonol-4-reductase